MPTDNYPPTPNEEGKVDSDALLEKAKKLETTPFDYIVVGSGAGGGPLAARLALAGRTVLVIEAGGDPREAKSREFPDAGPGEVHQCPGYHAAATEDAEMSWQFSVRHFDNDSRQAADEKYNKLGTTVDDGVNPPTDYPRDRRFLDQAQSGGRKGGVFYPRSAALGGCTAHHAMIMAAPNDRDWNYLANLTNDDSWRAEKMRGYFAKLERCLYLDDYRGFLRGMLGAVYNVVRWFALQLNPKGVLDRAGHGRDGWQATSFIDPFLVYGIAKGDRTFLKVLAGAALGVLHRNSRLVASFKQQLFKARLLQQIDPNDLNTRHVSPEGVFLIPTGIESGEARDEQKGYLLGRRAGVREFLLKTRNEHPERLVIAEKTHATRVIFASKVKREEGDAAPRAIGVETTAGEHLYEASPLREKPTDERTCYYARREVILCGGAFNTPQTLMLSGIGDREQLARFGIDGLRDCGGRKVADTVHLPGVGKNLQDRYEVSVISELDREFSSLDGVSFSPGDKNDPVRRQWVQDKNGLYRSNGGTLAVIRRSQAAQALEDEPEPDLFIFGVPAAFRGYYWGWSRELFRPTMGAEKDQRNLWSWVILKAYTRNNGGTVTLRSDSPFDCPEICFHSFDENAVDTDGWKHDIAALEDAVRFMRDINSGNPDRFIREIQPGPSLVDGTEEMRDWIRTQAWGHHCSCTCRIGADSWKADTAALNDKGAVLDSKFRVHGVEGLRIVDASVFPKIPGYFILTPILMVAEKAADTLLEDQSLYPEAIESAEATAIVERRRRAHPDSPESTLEPETAGRLPKNTVGLALSGGGIRSSTFSLGVLQTLATRNRVRDVDFLSTVSGGGFVGSFLGRLFTRDTIKLAGDPCGRVQEIVKNSNSGPLWWLRTQANYIFATGVTDVKLNVAIFWRNIFAVHLVIGALLFAVFGLLAWLPGVVSGYAKEVGTYHVPASLYALLEPPIVGGIPISQWWFLPPLALVLAVLPATIGYWLAPKVGSYRPYPIFPLLVWLLGLAGAAAGLLLPEFRLAAGVALVVLLLAWIWQEVARWGATQGVENEASRRKIGGVVRNRLSRSLGESVVIFVLLLAWVILDTLGALCASAREDFAARLAVLTAAMAPALPLLRRLGLSIIRRLSGGGEGGVSIQRAAEWIGIPLALFLLFVVDVVVHQLVLAYPGVSWGLAAIALAVFISVALGRAFDFLNLTSLHAVYAARLARTFQGASNEERIYSNATHARDIQLAHPKDDIPHYAYRPEEQGGPLHLINVCVNETVDFASERRVRERKGLPMCVSSQGVSVGRSYFARWCRPDALPLWQKRRRWRDGLDADDAEPYVPLWGGRLWKWLGLGGDAKRPAKEEQPPIALRALALTSDPHAFHVLASEKSESAEVEHLSLGAWTAISGAAFTTGIGRGTNLALSLFMGLANVRLGYWWDSGILDHERPGRFPASLWRKLQRLPVRFFRMQSLLLSEWTARFHGASRWFWYLSDGGHFEVTGLYELIRRRVPFMIFVDGGEDVNYRWGDLALLTQQVRIDFGAQIEWQTPERTGEEVDTAGWGAFRNPPPDWIQDWIEPNALGALADIRRQGTYHASLARVRYDDASDEFSWILVLKPSLASDLTEDLRNYAAEHADFPNQPTFDQVFDDQQWESHRALGRQVAEKVLFDPFKSKKPPTK